MPYIIHSCPEEAASTTVTLVEKGYKPTFDQISNCSFFSVTSIAFSGPDGGCPVSRVFCAEAALALLPIGTAHKKAAAQRFSAIGESLRCRCPQVWLNRQVPVK
ncbi:hypothetical protein [Paenibacillus jilunlii]|uniref:hypothetical protein n=1 Tax=Paenibacillus jilunlii TaxID=682956 RepID=UPI001B80020A|nr:hypothetical protein [Paenibacillus jilunlii]